MTTIAAAMMTIGAVPSPTPGTVSVVLAGADDDTDEQIADRPFTDAVGQVLGDAQFTLLAGHSRYIAEVSVDRETRGIGATRVARGPASAGIGNWGPVVAVPLGSKKTVYRDLVATTLTIRLMTRADHRRLWAGSAMTASLDGTPVATKLARAAFATYPQTLGRPISVP